ncbi:hypothetical protein RSOLAG22IIIB_12948 [Rhizoctonia solani]|uniref:Uncharacterized protein n=1 Tax=Rhizoctonia solani TaxID=456999 RepID=A0A0K6GH96_9AGAM|nr:hypothetical protein RSOLAG22IIIB_12948 [Rhizoctonia solani]
MTITSSELPLRQLIELAISEVLIQGILIPLLVDSVASERSYGLRFKLYVIFINILSLVHTVLRVTDALTALDSASHHLPLELSSIILTCGVSALTQAFFIHRCWRIFNKRMVLIAPYVAGLIVSIISGALIGLFSAGVIPSTPHEIDVVVGIWAFSGFTLDLCMTLTTIIYLYKLRSDHNDRDNVFLTVWLIHKHFKSSAAPPLFLMGLVIFDLYILPETLLPSALAAALIEKFLLLSLMITLTGQGYVRRQIERPRYTVPRGFVASQGTFGFVSEPGFVSRPGVYELEVRSVLETTRSVNDSEASRRGSYMEDMNRSRVRMIYSAVCGRY